MQSFFSPLIAKARTHRSAVLACLAGALALSALGPVAQARSGRRAPTGADGKSVQISGTIYGSFDYTFEGTGAWVGYALISFDGKPAKAAKFADRNTSFDQRKDGSIYGTEIISLEFTDGSGTFEISAAFEGAPSPAPNLFTLYETGTIGKGTGAYAGTSGYAIVHGPFLLPDPESTPGAAPWIAEFHGAIIGMK